MPPASITSLVYIDSTGYNYADYPSFQNWLFSVYQYIYGTDVYLQPDSQDGQFLSILAQAFYDTAALGASVYNSFSPLTAQGAGLSRVVKINGLTREVPSNSSVTLTIVGSAGTVITNGIAADNLGQQWILPATVIIPSGGSTNVVADAQYQGAVFAEANTITSIFTPTQGWQTVNNSSAAIPGDPVETDAALRIRQSKSTSLPALTPLDSTVAAVANVPEVSGVIGYENYTNSTDANGLPPHSFCIVYTGSPDLTALAQAIQVKKTPGTQTYSPSSTYTTVYDSQGMPINIYYQEAIGAEIQVQITINPLNGWSTTFEPLIAAAVAAVINALPIGGAANQGFGGQVFISQLYTAAYLNGAPQSLTYDISSIEIGLNGGGVGTSNISVNFDWQTFCEPSTDVTFVIT